MLLLLLLTVVQTRQVGRQDVAWEDGDSREEIGRIVHGQEAAQGERPYQVSVQFNFGNRLESSKPNHFCGGALIADRFVLTAAHCMKAATARRLKIVGGTNDISDSSSPTFGVRRITKHVYNDKTKVNDLALIELDTTAEAVSRMNTEKRPLIPVSLCRDSFQPQGKNCTVSGWGHLKAKGSSVPSLLREVSVTVLHDSICKKMLQGYPWDPKSNTMLCAGGEDKDACQGDSGGPLVCRDENNERCLAGVVSWGVGCATEGIPGVYTNVRKYNPWILDHIKGGGGVVDQADNQERNEMKDVLMNLIDLVNTKFQS